MMFSLRRLGLGCLTALAVHFNASAQAWQVFDMATAGLPSNTVMDVVSDADGVVWVATDWGLCRYQSDAWVIFNTSNSGLPDNVTRCVAVDQENAIWVGTSNGGAARYDGQSWEVFNTTNSALPDDQVNTIHVDHQGWVWLGTINGLICYTGTEWRLYNSTTESFGGLELNGDHILSVATRPDGLVAIGTLNSGFHFLTDTAVQFFTTFNFGFFDNTQHAIFLDLAANERWVACPAGALVRQIGDWYGGSWFQYTTINSDLPSNALKDVTGDGSGGLWLAAQVGGLIRRNSNGTFQSFVVTNSGIPSNQLNCVHRAQDGSVWVGTYDGGAARFDPTLNQDEWASREVGVSLWPNPSEGRFSVSGGHWRGEVRWMVADVQGREAASGEWLATDALDLDLRGLPQGSWLLRLEDGRTTTVKRFVVH